MGPTRNTNQSGAGSGVRSPESWYRSCVNIYPFSRFDENFSRSLKQPTRRISGEKERKINLWIFISETVTWFWFSIFDFWFFVWSRVSEPRVWSWWRRSGSWKSSRIFRRILPRLAAQVSSSFFALDPRVFLCLLFWCAWSVEKFVFDLDFVSDSKCFLDKFFRQK